MTRNLRVAWLLLFHTMMFVVAVVASPRLAYADTVGFCENYAVEVSCENVDVSPWAEAVGFCDIRGASDFAPAPIQALDSSTLDSAPMNGCSASAALHSTPSLQGDEVPVSADSSGGELWALPLSIPNYQFRALASHLPTFAFREQFERSGWSRGVEHPPRLFARLRPLLATSALLCARHFVVKAFVIIALTCWVSGQRAGHHKRVVRLRSYQNMVRLLANTSRQKNSPNKRLPFVFSLAHSDSFEGSKMNKGTASVGFVLSFLAGMMLMYGIDRNNPGIKADHDSKPGAAHAPAAAHGSDGEGIPITAQDPVWGKADAPVTVVIFSDFECPFCKKVEDTLKQVKETYKDKVRMVWKHQPLPMHKNAKPASVASQAVFKAKGSDAFWKFHGLAFENNRALTPENFEKWAAECGVDAATLKKNMADPEVTKAVDDATKLAEKIGSRGTPHFYINGAELSGAQPFEKFKETIDREMGKAEAKIKSGVKADKVYAEMVKENFKAPAAAAEKKPEGDKKDPKQEQKEDDKTVWKVPVGKSPAKGPADAPVTIVIFSDYQCPFCKRVEETVTKVTETYKDKVRLVWKDQPLPFHPRAKPAAILTREALAQKGVGAFWEAHDKLFASAPKLEDADLEKIAEELKLDVNKFKDAVKNDKYKADIDTDQGLAEDLNASGTPHFFVNGRRLVGAQPFEKFQGIIDEEIKKADEMKAKGTPAAKIYDEIMKNGKEPPPPETKDVAPPPKDSPSRGGDKAKVVIQMFSDFQCPFCGKVEPTMNDLLKAYGDKIKIVWRHKPLPFHKEAPLASEASVEVLKQKGSEAFWKYHDKLFENQKTPGGLERPALEKYAEELGCDMTKFKKSLDDHTHKAAVDADSKAADDAGISGTPSFVINKYFLSGAQPIGKFKKAIDKALAEAK